MSDIIKILPDAVANQIAAGEVIQRPASVLKELVENAIDAGASHVQICVFDAGKTCVQVIDDGKGMSETDARLAFERHATSKIREATDLFALRTMGFRGEALPSIAAVAQVELKTKSADNDLGVKIKIEGSKVKEQLPEACLVGTNISVRNLFFNIPARRKFLKSNQTEMANIMMEFERIAIVHADVAFSLYADDNLILELPAGNLRRRIIGIFGRKMDEKLVPVTVETPIVRIHGFVGTPASARKKGLHQFFFVNNRFMKHPYFAKAVQAAFERLIPEGEQVHYFLELDVLPERLDVNIHPSKTEIKFQDDQAIWQILLAAVREALGKYNAIPTIDFDTANRPSIPVFDPSVLPPDAPEIPIDPDFNPFNQGNVTDAVEEKPTFGPVRGNNAVSAKWATAYADFGSLSEVTEKSAPPQLFDDSVEKDQEDWVMEDFDSFQFCGRFIVVSRPEGLLLVDHHRAHLRILYDRYLKQIAEHKGISQGLLFPQILQFSPAEDVSFAPLLTPLAELGFDITSLGGGAYSVSGIPAGTEGLDPAELLRAVQNETHAQTTELAEAVNHRLILSLAGKAAMPVGQALSGEEIKDLLKKLIMTSNANYDPSGKPICSLLTTDNVMKLFD